MTDKITSRYDLMVPSSQVDIDNQQYPDVLSVDMKAFELLEPPIQYPMDQSFKRKPYQIIGYFYRNTTNAQYDDIVLTINSIPHKDLIEEGDTIIIPVTSDMLNFINKWKLNGNI